MTSHTQSPTQSGTRSGSANRPRIARIKSYQVIPYLVVQTKSNLAVSYGDWNWR